MKTRRFKLITLFLILLTLFLTACSVNLKPENNLTIGDSNTLRVHFIDIGQGDCALIQTPGGKNMLIDAGNPGDYDIIADFLDSQQVERLDAVIATHPHSDHIGSMSEIINHYAISDFYAPEATANTATFKKMMQAIEAKGLTITPAQAGTHFTLDDGVEVTMYSPNAGDRYDDANNYSPITRVAYQDVSFLFTGDAEVDNEEEAIANASTNLKSDVLKVGHHGSSTSTSDAFLSIVNPQYAVISVGEGNDYGHPHRETLEKLDGTTLYRTDEDGTVSAISDGQSIHFVTTNDSTMNHSQSNQATEKNYIGNINSKKFHTPDCSGLPQESNRVYFTTRDDAIAKGYSPCGQCKP